MINQRNEFFNLPESRVLDVKTSSIFKVCFSLAFAARNRRRGEIESTSVVASFARKSIQLFNLFSTIIIQLVLIKANSLFMPNDTHKSQIIEQAYCLE